MGLLILDCFCTELLFIFWSSDPCVVFYWTGAKWARFICLIYTNKTPNIHFLSSIKASTVSHENPKPFMSSWDFTGALHWTLIQNRTGTLRRASFLHLSPNTPISHNWDFRKVLENLTASQWPNRWFSILDLRFHHPSCFWYVSASAQLVQMTHHLLRWKWIMLFCIFVSIIYWLFNIIALRRELCPDFVEFVYTKRECTTTIKTLFCN